METRYRPGAGQGDHRRVTRLLLRAFALAAAVDLASLAADWDIGHLVTKPLLMPLLAAYAASRGAPRLLIAALLCGWGGDVLLLFDADPAFLAGMASFAAGHVCYIVLFQKHGTDIATVRARGGFLAVIYTVMLSTTIQSLWPDLPADLRVPVAGYSVLLTVMAYLAAARMGRVAGIGGVLFVLSDTLIASGVADWDQLPRPDLWIMLTYVAAQSLLVTGALGERRLPGAAYGEVRSTTP
ncbi:lysoplasmalogenase [Streptomyces justiciae]|uniref:lysoplasmalogenase n=1 Tax=Streptomyces justiciae TaxID=2780140 RepID=UPI0018820DC0|nr:lysoplasmalogenase [Streptomyces justiciae]MBE8473260.1 lysoplasmalogenase [Streptomyces justiciae]